MFHIFTFTLKCIVLGSQLRQKTKVYNITIKMMKIGPKTKVYSIRLKIRVKTKLYSIKIKIRQKTNVYS